MNEHWWFVGAGYAITWGTLAWYLLRLRSRERAAKADSAPDGGGAWGGDTG